MTMSMLERIKVCVAVFCKIKREMKRERCADCGDFAVLHWVFCDLLTARICRSLLRR